MCSVLCVAFQSLDRHVLVGGLPRCANVGFTVSILALIDGPVLCVALQALDRHVLGAGPPRCDNVGFRYLS